MIPHQRDFHGRGARHRTDRAVALVFTDFTGTVLTDYNLPTSLSLSSFGDAGLIGPDFIS